MRIRLTGQVPLGDEEFATLAERAVLMTSIMAASVLLMLWFAVRSFRLVLCIVATLFSGLAITTAFGLQLAARAATIAEAFSLQLCPTSGSPKQDASQLELTLISGLTTSPDKTRQKVE